MINEIIADLTGWQTQLEERAKTLKKDQDAFNKQMVLIQNAVTDHVKDVVMPLGKPKHNTSVPSAKSIRGMVHKVLTSKKQVLMKEVVSKVCTLSSVERDSAKGAKVAQRTYSALSALKNRKLIKGGRKGLSLTAYGRPFSKHWS